MCSCDSKPVKRNVFEKKDSTEVCETSGNTKTFPNFKFYYGMNKFIYVAPPHVRRHHRTLRGRWLGSKAPLRCLPGGRTAEGRATRRVGADARAASGYRGRRAARWSSPGAASRKTQTKTACRASSRSLPPRNTRQQRLVKRNSKVPTPH